MSFKLKALMIVTTVLSACAKKSAPEAASNSAPLPTLTIYASEDYTGRPPKNPNEASLFHYYPGIRCGDLRDLQIRPVAKSVSDPVIVKMKEIKSADGISSWESYVSKKKGEIYYSINKWISPDGGAEVTSTPTGEYIVCLGSKEDYSQFSYLVMKLQPGAKEWSANMSGSAFISNPYPGPFNETGRNSRF